MPRTSFRNGAHLSSECASSGKSDVFIARFAEEKKHEGHVGTTTLASTKKKRERKRKSHVIGPITTNVRIELVGKTPEVFLSQG